MGIILVVYYPIYLCFESDLSNTIFSNGEINNLFIKKSNIFGTSFTNTEDKKFAL